MSRNKNKKHRNKSENMKKKITVLLLILAIMAAIPLFFGKNNIKIDTKTIFKSKTPGKIELISSAAAYHFRESYSGETLKAIILILNSNNKAGKLDKKQTLSKSEFLNKYKNGKDYYSKIENTVKKLSDKYITYKNKAVYIPCHSLSKGYTEKNKKYPYLKSCACPWDVTQKGYNEKSDSIGISLNSLDALCKNGLNAEKALEHFLEK